MKLTARTSLASITAVVTVLVSTALPVVAQTTLTLPSLGPAAPTTADLVVLRMPGRCNAAYRNPSYSLRMSGTNIYVQQRYIYPPPPCPAPPAGESAFPVFAEIGRLPAGTYNIDITGVSEIAGTVVESAEYLSIPLVVTAKSASTTGPVPFISYAGHWWDESDLGAGFMIWQGDRDAILLAWFTYALDGTAAWYSLQGGHWVSATRYEGPLYRTSRPPNPNAPHSVTNPVATAAASVGTASLDFSGRDGIDSGVFTATLSAGGQVTRNIRRFGK